MYRTNYVEIDEEALADNARALSGATAAEAGRRAALMAVVKANGYGHGGVLAARAALRGGAAMLGVATAEEGEALREEGITAPVLVLGNVEPGSAAAVARLGLAQTVCDREGLVALERAARERASRTAVHLKLDTGMGRLGVRDAAEAIRLAQAVADSHWLEYAGVFTHFACADEPDPRYTLLQHARFQDMLSALSHAGLIPPLRHAANSAATLRFPDTHYDMVRAGIALYGAPPVETQVPLRPAMRWVTRASLVKELGEGEGISYGATFVTQRPTRVMVLPVGYADGYRRTLGGRAQVLVRGAFAPIVGRVCMDQCMADVTDIPGCEVGDEVVLLGTQGSRAITADDLAGWMNTISYEALLAPSARVPRVRQKGGA